MNIYTKLILVLVVIGGLGYASYLYMTRPTEGPSQTPPTNQDLPKKYSEEEKSNLFSISTGSKAQYDIYEELNGEPVTVVGSTDQVFGDFILNTEDITQSTINTISINARTFKTDNDRRDNALVRYILHSEDEGKEFITFETTSIEKVADSMDSDNSYKLKINGDLTISGVSKPATFMAEVSMESEEQINIMAEGKLFYKDYGLQIPELPFLANVSEEINLTLDLIAKQNG